MSKHVECDICKKNITDQPRHDVIEIEPIGTDKVVVGDHINMIGIIVCNRCMANEFVYCETCDTYYEKQYVTDGMCMWCVAQQ